MKPQDIEMDDAAGSLSGFAVVVAGRTHVGRVRENNEDAFVITDVGDGTTLLGVSDGMGGHAAGEIASALVVDGLVRSLVAEHRPALAALRHAVTRAHHDVLGAAAADDRRHGMGATLVAALVAGRAAYIAAVGDSRAYQLRGGKLELLTHDQSAAQALVDAGILQPADAAVSPLRHVLASAMGHGDDVGAELFAVELASGDRLVLCTDGLTNEVGDDEIVGLASAPASVEDACERLIEAANRHGGNDNVTVVVAEVVEVVEAAPRGRG